MKNIINAILVTILIANVSFADDESEKAKEKEMLKVLDLFVGEWKGKATAYYERDKDREPRIETVKINATKILKNTYVKMESVWTTPDGNTRELLVFFNYNRRTDKFDILFLYDNWPGKVNYPVEYNPDTRMFSGYDTFTASGGVAAEEKVTWEISEDGNEIRSVEYNHYETDPKDYWAKSFEYVLKKIK